MQQEKWTKEQTIIALYLYCNIPFNKVSSSNQDILKFSTIIGRSPNSLKMKIGNFGSFDPILKSKGIVGLTNTSKMDKDIWLEYSNDWGKLSLDSEVILSKLEGKEFDSLKNDIEFSEKSGTDKLSTVKTRINQDFFRRTVLSSYNYSCAITGLKIPELLIASHIIPWKDRLETRVNPHNGISLNAFHDKAFDKGLITITTDYKVKVSNYVFQLYDNKSVKWFKEFDNASIVLPDRFSPNIDFLKFHNDNIFEQWKKIK
ncbi:MAG: HNH endonuclease [Bacteroidales bacterium]|nr:HNH endonuclease [Bacteroidales bacterium]